MQRLFRLQLTSSPVVELLTSSRKLLVSYASFFSFGIRHFNRRTIHPARGLSRTKRVLDNSCGRKGEACSDVRQQQRRQQYNGGDKGKAGIATPACCSVALFTVSEVFHCFQYRISKILAVVVPLDVYVRLLVSLFVAPSPADSSARPQTLISSLLAGPASNFVYSSNVDSKNQRAGEQQSCVFFFPTRAGVYFLPQMKTRNVFDRTSICPFSRLIICCM